MFETVTKIFASILCSVLLAGVCTAQSIKFNHLTTDNGLSNGNVRTIIQDYQGFMWFGTEDGLQRFDGYNLVEYRHDPDDATSLSSNFIFRVYEDSKKNLWVGTMDGGLCWYNRAANNFRCFQNDPDDSTSIISDLIRCMTESSDGKIYLGFKERGFSYFTIPNTIPEKLTFNNFKISSIGDDPASTWVSDILEDDDRTMLMAVIGGGVYRFDPQTKNLSHIFKDSVTARAQRLTIDSKKRLWISTWGDGVFVYDKATKRFVNHSSGEEEGRLKHDQIEDVEEDSEGNLWMPTDNGLAFLDKRFDPFGHCEFVTYTHNPLEPTSLLGNAVKAFYIDKLQRLWIGSYFGGINIYDKNALKFDPIRHRVWAEGSLSNSNVSAFAQEASGNLWIGTDGGGLNFLKGGVENLRKDQFKKLNIRWRGQPVEKVKSLAFDKDGNLWMGTWGFGLFKINPSDLSYTRIGNSSDPTFGLLANEIMALKNDQNNNFWIGTFSGGISFYDTHTQKFTHYPNLAPFTSNADRYNIKTVHIDRKNRVWVGSEVKGLALFDSAAGTFRIIKNDILADDVTVLSIHEDNDGTLWLGTNGTGLISFNPDTQSTKRYDTKSGLANNVIYAVEQDEKTGNFWLSTNKGLSQLNPTTNEIKNYSRVDGLQGNQYNPESSYVCSDGTVLFGGINGMDAFNPADIQTSNHIPEIVFTSFFLDNVEVNVGDIRSPLRENIILADTIELRHYQNSFSIGFSLLEFSFTNRNQYAYKLEGFNDSWQTIGNERKATFTNVEPGRYLLRVKASNSDGQWTTEDKTLYIRVHPAWWQTTLFKISIIALFIITAISVYKIRINYLIRQKRKLKKKVKQKTRQLKLKNAELTEKIEEIRAQNEVLHKQKIQIVEKNNEIQAQNEELTAQNDQIILQRENLRIAEQKLKEANEQLEAQVEQRTRKLEETIQQLDKTVTELDRFVYSASHDLSAPLKSVLGLVQIARMEKELDRVGEYYNHIEFSVQKLDRVIKSMVEFSRNYHLDVQTAVFDFHELVSEVLLELAFWPEARKVQFRNAVPKGSIIRSDSQRMKVVLHNLISNSVKYADFTKPESFIHISYERNGSINKIMISDNGMGIEAERQTRIFEMYYRATDRSHGSGLGLFIVKEIILKLGGTIEVQSVYGQSSTFIITIPDPVEANQGK